MKKINQQLLSDLMSKAVLSDRKRSHFLVHDSYADPVQKPVTVTETEAVFGLSVQASLTSPTC